MCISPRHFPELWLILLGFQSYLNVPSFLFQLDNSRPTSQLVQVHICETILSCNAHLIPGIRPKWAKARKGETKANVVKVHWGTWTFALTMEPPQMGVKRFEQQLRRDVPELAEKTIAFHLRQGHRQHWRDGENVTVEADEPSQTNTQPSQTPQNPAPEPTPEIR
jgi:hypothetical protein